MTGDYVGESGVDDSFRDNCVLFYFFGFEEREFPDGETGVGGADFVGAVTEPDRVGVTAVFRGDFAVFDFSDEKD